ncbi:hypothetical protein ACIPUB_00315 [Paeniglutamicibacter sp. ORCA_105]|uniref:hypothetical protein n=1 Tax=Paeniglutamicibacter sp. ORCA_105 TaxID=3377336 RepID=UPI00389614FB
MTDPLNDIELEIIENGEDDWVLFLHIMGIINEAKGSVLTEDEAIAEATGSVLALCAKGYAQLGRYTGPTSFVPWPETGDALRTRLERELKNPPPGEGHEGNLMYIMLDILPDGQYAKDEQSQ